MSNYPQKESRLQTPNRNSKMALPAWTIVLIVIGIILYQFFGKGSDGEGTLQPITPTVVTSAPPTTIVQRPPTVATSSSTSHSTASFDFYMLALSWSPDYCSTSGDNDPQQCSIGKKLGFVLHGLWPQYNQGYPSNCSNVKMPDSVQAKFPGLYPSTSLYDHEWEKHGTCSGLSPEQYLTLSKRLKDSVVIPNAYRAPEQPIRVTTSQFKKEFTTANLMLTELGLAVNCSGSGRFLQEMYLCFSPEGTPTACSREIHNDEAKSCQNADFLVRNVR